MRALLVAALISGATVTPSAARFYNYFEWQRLPEDYRTAYVTGAFDSFVTFAFVEASNHFGACVNALGISAGQFTRNIETYASSRPSEQRLGVPSIMLHYLLELCGPAPSN
jgi:hypothetical protein